MGGSEFKDAFLAHASEWLCNSYSLQIRYLAVKVGEKRQILDAVVLLGPRTISAESDFEVDISDFHAGQVTYPQVSKASAEAVIQDSILGKISTPRVQLTLHSSSSLEFFSTQSDPNNTLHELHLQITGEKVNSSTLQRSSEIDFKLRLASPPFDGIEDLKSWLGLTDPRASHRQATISIRVLPPVDLGSKFSLSNNHLHVELLAHPKCNVETLNLAIREFPGDGVRTRKQVASSIKWGRPRSGVKRGQLVIDLSNAFSVQILLSSSTRTIRRYWIHDSTRAINSRYVATQLFDTDLKQLRDALQSSTDSERFERGVASILFLLGYSPAIQLERNAPDILFSSPSGSIAVVECTTRIADFQNKLGKLVDRRNLLNQSLKDSGHSGRAVGLLVCGLSRSQIAVDEKQLIQHQVHLVCREDLAGLFSKDTLRIPPDPEKALTDAFQQLALKKSALPN